MLQENDNEPDNETSERWRNDPNNWKLGMFYFNPQDKRLFPPKRIKWFGWTTNFANPLSIFALFILLIVIILVAESAKYFFN